MNEYHNGNIRLAIRLNYKIRYEFARFFLNKYEYIRY